MIQVGCLCRQVMLGERDIAAVFCCPLLCMFLYSTSLFHLLSLVMAQSRKFTAFSEKNAFLFLLPFCPSVVLAQLSLSLMSEDHRTSRAIGKACGCSRTAKYRVRSCIRTNCFIDWSVSGFCNHSCASAVYGRYKTPEFKFEELFFKGNNIVYSYL